MESMWLSAGIFAIRKYRRRKISLFLKCLFLAPKVTELFQAVMG